MKVSLHLTREEALYLLDALNTERFRLQDRAAECFANREPNERYHYALTCIEYLIQYADSELENQFIQPSGFPYPSEEELEAMADYFGTGKKT